MEHPYSYNPHTAPPDRKNWPKIRLYINAPLDTAQKISLNREQGHYILTVMRQNIGNAIRVFNGYDGEWACEITDVHKKNLTLLVQKQLRPQTDSPDVWLLFAPVKKAHTDMIIQKATELGISRLLPVKTHYSESLRVNLDRFKSIAVEAAEQSERLDIPVIDELKSLTSVLTAWPENRSLFWADETGGTPLTSQQGPAAALIGPEGGFAREDRQILDHKKFIIPVSLGPRILRAETAAIVLISHLT